MSSRTIKDNNSASGVKAYRAPNKTICLSMIVKNEEKTIKRCLDSLQGIIDFGSITDTGSTDNTMTIIEWWFKENNIPLDLVEDEFTNFRDSRNKELEHAVRSFKPDFILLSDSDFVWEMKPNFNRRLLLADLYKVRQISSEGTSESYYNDNVRLLNAKYLWKYKMVTHEFVEKDDRIQSTLSTLVIHDKGDGGSKSDKYVRDINLLTKELMRGLPGEEGYRSRYLFYLARSFDCNGELEKAINTYKVRVSEKGGWDDEKLISMIGISKCYYKMYEREKGRVNNPPKESISITEGECNGFDIKRELSEVENLAQENIDLCNGDIDVEGGNEYNKYLVMCISWAIRGYKFQKHRVESLYFLLYVCRLHRLYNIFRDWWDIANSIKMPSSGLWISPNYYNYMVKYELTIVGYYLGGEYKEKAVQYIIELSGKDDVPENIKKVLIRNSGYYN